jgi:hypothetical protein
MVLILEKCRKYSATFFHVKRVMFSEKVDRFVKYNKLLYIYINPNLHQLHFWKCFPSHVMMGLSFRSLYGNWNVCTQIDFTLLTLKMVVSFYWLSTQCTSSMIYLPPFFLPLIFNMYVKSYDFYVLFYSVFLLTQSHAAATQATRPWMSVNCTLIKWSWGNNVTGMWWF